MTWRVSAPQANLRPLYLSIKRPDFLEFITYKNYQQLKAQNSQ